MINTVAETGKDILSSWTTILTGVCAIALALMAFWKGLMMNINKKIEAKASQSDLENLEKRVDAHDIDLKESRDRSIDTNDKVNKIWEFIAKMNLKMGD